MKQRLVELVNVILRRIEEHPESSFSENGMRSWLAGQGYNKRDIEAAIKLVRPQFTARPAYGTRTPGTVRHLSSFEAQKLSPEARDALARLELYELIEPYEREILLDRLGQIEGIVGLEDLDYLVGWILCSTRDVESQQTIYNVIEGGCETLH